MKRTMQIGVIGSMADRTIVPKIQEIASELGIRMASEGMVLLFGYEGDFDSLSFLAARSAQEKGGRVIAFVHEGASGIDVPMDIPWIRTGQQRGGGREFSFVLSCDAIIAIQGGSGTLMEIAMAYQAGIPVIVFRDSGGWSGRLADTFLDDRKRAKIIGVKTPEEAVQKAIDVLA